MRPLSLTLLALLASMLPFSLGGCTNAEVKSGVPDEGSDAGTATKPGSQNEDGEDVDAAVPSETENSVRHASCRNPQPNPLPSVAELDPSAIKNDVNAWASLSCELANAQLACGPAESCDDRTPICLRADEKRSHGICGVGRPSSDKESKAPTTLLSYREGACIVTAQIQEKAAACCQGLDGFDCRTYPFGTRSKPGQRCARHIDCEQGLVCEAPGFCACPGEPVQIDDPACLPNHEPLPWVGEFLPDEAPGTCTAAPSGYRIDVLDSMGSRNAYAALAPDGSLHVFYFHEGSQGSSTRHGTNASGSWVIETLALPVDPARKGLAYEPAGVAIDAEGFFHVAFDTHGFQYATNRSGKWELTELVGPDVATVGDIALDPDGAAHFAYATPSDGLSFASPDGEGFVTSVVAATLPAAASRVQLIMTGAELPNMVAGPRGTHILVEFAKGKAHHYAATDALFTKTVLSAFERIDAVDVGESGMFGMGAEKTPPGRVLFCPLSSDCPAQVGDGNLIWEQPASRYERAAASVRMALASGGMFGTHTAPEGRFVVIGLLDFSESAMVTTDISPADLIADAEGRDPHLFIAGGRSLFHVSKGTCPPPP